MKCPARAENGRMAPISAWTVFVLAATFFVAAILAMQGVGRAAERRNRGLARERLLHLIDAWRIYAARGGDSRSIRHQARSADEALFWSVLETLSLDLPRASRRTLTAALARIHHVRNERWALRDDSPWRRELAARRLSLIFAMGTRRALRAAIERGPEPVAYTAALGLAHQRHAWTLRWVLDHPFYFASRPARARTALLRAFGPGATPLLAARLELGISDPALERAVIERLGAAGHSASGAAIAARLTNPDLELRVAAARALGRLGDRTHSDALGHALRDEAWQVRAQAAHALGHLGVADAVPGLAGALTDSAWWVRRHAAYALAELGVEGTAALSGEAHASPDRYAREMATEALEATAPKARTRKPAARKTSPGKKLDRKTPATTPSMRKRRSA